MKSRAFAPPEKQESEMPVKGTKKQIMKTEMHKFKEGKLHSGSKHGNIVRKRSQAIAIGLSEARKAGKK